MTSFPYYSKCCNDNRVNCDLSEFIKLLIKWHFQYLVKSGIKSYSYKKKNKINFIAICLNYLKLLINIGSFKLRIVLSLRFV